MAQQIVSLKHKTGTYEGNAYDNYMRSLYFRLKLWDCLHLWIKKEKRSYAIICATDNLTVDMNLIAMQILNVMEIVKLANILFNLHIVTIVPDVLKLSQMCDIM